MPRIACRLIAPLLLLLASAAFAQPAATPRADPAQRAAFVADTAQKYGLEPAQVEAWLDRSNYRQSIVDAMSRPAESVKTWKQYRPIFIVDRRITEGRAFLARHREQLAKVEADTGVPAEIIVAIIGVETSYGGNTGSYPVLDALYTLAFFYPISGKPDQVEREAMRTKFFRDELAQVMLLAKEEKLDLAALKGSYAGAMGYGQFMPSSYRAYARDGDGDGRRDLFGSLPDVFASVANYFVAHGWQKGEPVPRAEPTSTYGNRSPYTVLGKSYQVLERADGYVERGMASWYGQKFHGRQTSSREVYDMCSFSAAHKTLPLPSYVRVTNLDNGRSAIVRVNDRGPFHPGRIIDLSYAAAVKLGVDRTGTARVEVEAISGGGAQRPALAPAVTSRAPTPTSPDAVGRQIVQVGAYRDEANARRIVDQLRAAGIQDIQLEDVRLHDGKVWRVRVGPVAPPVLEGVLGRIRALGLPSPRVFSE